MRPIERCEVHRRAKILKVEAGVDGEPARQVARRRARTAEQAPKVAVDCLEETHTAAIEHAVFQRNRRMKETLAPIDAAVTDPLAWLT